MTTFGELKCEICEASNSKTPLFRNGPKGPGSDPHWRCEGCTNKPIDPLVKDITDAIG